MADVVVTGGGVCGLLTAMLLAKDGHEVTVLERDGMDPPADPEEAWDRWERRGVNQFRLLHFLLPRFRHIAEAELPEVCEALDEAGALRYSIVGAFPEFVTGGEQPGDDRFESITARRPVLELAIARAVDRFPTITVRRGVAVDGVTTGASVLDGVPHVTGVRTSSGESITADLVVDASGRRSALPRWLEAAGARAPYEELEDCGFVYYGRHFQSPDRETLPAPLGPPLQDFGSFSVLTLVADRGSWGIGVVTSANDKALRAGMKDTAKWEAVIRELPTVAHWLDGQPLDDHVVTMAKIEDRYRRYVVDGTPVATGVVAVADSWACTNPSVGRGISIGLLHATVLRDTLAKQGLDDHAAFVTAFDEATVERAEPFFRDTLWGDRHRLEAIDAAIEGRPYETDDERWNKLMALGRAAASDPEILRANVDMGSLLALPEEVFERPGLLDKAAEAADAPPMFPAPTRERIVELVS